MSSVFTWSSCQLVVDDPHVAGRRRCASGAGAPLLVDVDAVLPGSVAVELFEPVA
ncbi:hypothetical protein ACL03H_07095 [Saccharopolyspora sp. MS10]|uniref:hypothetical protein n=1 Tax=Saccharopolyspora sp. MS10 TaxID=3385973 RepID=UPI00399F770C